MVAEIITIGDELLIGQIVDSNSAWLAAQLNDTGIAVRKITSVGDQPVHLKEALDGAFGYANLVILTGGLGPTRDDKTKAALRDYFGGEMIVHEPTLTHVKRIFSRLDLPVLEVNLHQALVPDSCQVLPNPNGTAPGMWFERAGKVCIALPGVPHEMKDLTQKQILPRLREFFKGRFEQICHKVIITAGIGESLLAEMIAEVENTLPPHIRLAYLPNLGTVRLRLSGRGADNGALRRQVSDFARKIIALARPYVIAEEDLAIHQIIINELKKRNQTLATAESCTGGYIAHLITTEPGASEVFKGGVVVYSNELKQRLLQVRPDTLEDHGAVSRQAVEEMAQAAVSKLHTDFAIAVSGVAGPGGGTPEKPVGTVWIAVAGKDRVNSRRFLFGNKRMQNIQRSATAALNMLYQFMHKS